MAQLQITRFGGIEVLEMADINLTEPVGDEVLLDVLYASMNPVDTKTRAGLGWAAQQHKDDLPWTPGFDVCGIITAMGPNVQEFEIGQRVCGLVLQGGAYASQMKASASLLVPVPKKITHAQAAALPTAGLTAWQALTEHAEVKAGDVVAVYAAAGGVGHLAVQLAHHLGAQVIALASEDNHDFVRKLGADTVLDYHDPAVFTPCLGQVDVVLDLVGGQSGLDALQLLKPDGRQITVPTVAAENIKTAAAVIGKRAMGMLVRPDPQALANLLDLCVHGQLQAHVSRVYSLQDVPKAHQAIENGHIRGKLLIDPRNLEM